MVDETGIDAAGFDVAGLDAAERRVDEWEADLDRRAARKMTARNADGSVAVTVNASGRLVDLRLTEQTRLRPAAETAREILATFAAASSGR